MVNISRHWPEIRRDVHLTHQVVCYTDIHPDNSDWTDHLSISVYHGLTDATAATLTSGGAAMSLLSLVGTSKPRPQLTSALGGV